MYNIKIKISSKWWFNKYFLYKWFILFREYNIIVYVLKKYKNILLYLSKYLTKLNVHVLHIQLRKIHRNYSFFNIYYQ